MTKFGWWAIQVASFFLLEDPKREETGAERRGSVKRARFERNQRVFKATSLVAEERERET
jgi:hypothetical protein